jgi:hypothetical protein
LVLEMMMQLNSLQFERDCLRLKLSCVCNFRLILFVS